MSIFRRIMLSGGLNIDIDSLPETQKIYYTATAKVTPASGTIGRVIANNYNNDTGEGVMCFNSDVIKIGTSAFAYNNYLTSINIPNSVTEVGHYAFEGCSSLTSITIPDSVTSIGSYAFLDCRSLISITIPDNVTSIGNSAFQDCTGELIINSKIVETDYTNKNFPSKYSWLKGSGFTTLTIGNNINKIGSYAFNGCVSLKSISIPDSVTSIGSYAFSTCDSLTSIIIPESVTSIGSYAFAFCDSLTSVYCVAITPQTLGGTCVFDGNPVGRLIYVPADSLAAYKSNGYWRNYKPDIVGYDFENGVILMPKQPNDEIWYTNGSTTESTTPYQTDVFGANIISNTYDAEKECWVIKFDGVVQTLGNHADSAFKNCKNLISVNIPDRVYLIGYQAFYGCSSLTSITIGDSVTGDGVTEIGKSAFYGCSNLKSIIIPDNVTSIGNYTFYNCTSLTNITIPNSVTSIGERAFSFCSSLTSITIPDSITTIGEDAFLSCNRLISFKGKYATDDGRSLIMNNTIITYANASGTTYTIPDSVTSIGSDAFYNCESLTSVTIPDSVTEIGYEAFRSCSLTSIEIPVSVTTIGNYAFNYCSSLTSVYCKATTPPVLGYQVFAGNGSGRKIYVPMESVEAYKSASYWSEYASAIEGYEF